LQLRARQASLAEALLSFNGEEAAALVRAHVLVQGERFTDLVASLRPAITA
jgi:hypothetical protein